MNRRGLTSIFLLAAAAASADSITVGKTNYKDVLVERDKNHFYIHLPEEGRVVKVSRKRRDVSTPVIEADTARREQWRRRFEETRPQSPDQSAAPFDQELNNFVVKAHHGWREQALFEAQFAHWRRLSPAQRQSIDAMLLSNMFGEIGDFVQSADAMGADTSGLRSRINQAILGGFQGDGPTGPLPAPRMSPPSSGGTGRTPQVKRTQRDALALSRGAIDGAKRVLDYKILIDQLASAMSNGYRPRLNTDMVKTWEGNLSRKTTPFTIDAPFWRLECRRDDFGVQDAFSVTVFDAETDRPFTRLGSLDPLQMRVRVLEGPGRYYLKIEQDQVAIPYTIEAVTFPSP